MIHAVLPSQRFCLIRHGETTANAEGIIAGITDVPLTELGCSQARALAARHWPEPIAVYSSPMIRAQHTAQLAFPNHAIEQHPGLRERDWGVFEGRPLTELPPRDEAPENGESWSEMLNRVRITIEKICAASEGHLPMIVCHSGVIRAARVLWTTGDVGQRPPNATPLLFQKNGQKLSETPL